MWDDLKAVARFFFVLSAIYPVVVGLVVAIGLGVLYFVISDEDTVEISVGAFAVAIGLGGLCYTAASAFSASDDQADRDTLAKSGGVVSLGSLLFLGAAMLRLAGRMVRGTNWLPAGAKRMVGGVLWGFSLFPYFMGTLFVFAGLLSLSLVLANRFSEGR